MSADESKRPREEDSHDESAKRARTEPQRAHRLSEELHQKLTQLRAQRAFNAAAWTDTKTDMLNDYLRKAGLSGCVVSVSGGVDSAVTIALCARAAAKPNSPIKRVVGVAQPIHSTASIQERAYEVGRALNIEIITVDQSAAHTALCANVEGAVGIPGEGFARGQLRSYMRTPVGYYVAQLLSQNGTPALVLGTGNYDEDGYLLYYCKAGDGVCDIQLIADLHKSEVFAVAAHVGVPNSILVAPPSADLWEGQTDEDELGFTYDFVELYTEFLKFPEADKATFLSHLTPAGREEFETLGAAADKVHRRNAHKANSPFNINVDFPTLRP